MEMPVFQKLSIVLFFLLMLQGCAQSDVTRCAACPIDKGYIHTNNAVCGSYTASLTDYYNNMPQAGRGALLGGVAGAVTGQLSSQIGLGPGALIGAILGGAYGAYIDSHTTLIDKIENRGVKIFILGDPMDSMSCKVPS